MVANRSHQQHPTNDQQVSPIIELSPTPSVRRSLAQPTTASKTSSTGKTKSKTKTKFMSKTMSKTRGFAFLLSMAAFAANMAGSTLEAHAQGKTAGPAIPKLPAAPARPTATPAPTPTPAATPPTPSAAPKPRRATTPKAKPAPKARRAVVKSTRSSRATPKAKTVSTGGTSSGGGFGQGASGPRVVAVQERLAVLHYDITSNDGKFGDQLYHAVMAFQKVNGLSRSGRVNAQTLAALETAADPEPLLATGGADRVEVDLQKQYLALYKGGAIYRLLSISSGSGKEFCVYDPETKKTECDKAVTPGGSFRVRSRWVGWRESKLGLLYNPLYFNGGIAIHGAPSVPATPASHGCVRIPMISAQWFPEQVADGTPVYVFGGQEGAPVPLKSKAPADAKFAPTTAPTDTLATIPPAGTGPATTKPASAAPSATPTTTPASNTLATVPTTVVPSTTVAPTTTTTTGLARLLTPIGSPSPVATTPGATVVGVIAGTVNAGVTATTASGGVATPIATQINGAGTTTTTRPAGSIVTSVVGATPIATAVRASATSTTTSTVKL
jgi:peptidoglycan hydrolase-like protein with peptidoglycan-binding domain